MEILTVLTYTLFSLQVCDVILWVMYYLCKKNNFDLCPILKIDKLRQQQHAERVSRNCDNSMAEAVINWVLRHSNAQ